MKLAKFLDRYDNWCGTLVINDGNCDFYARVELISITKWLNEHKSIANAKVMAFGFYDNELCVRVNI